MKSSIELFDEMMRKSEDTKPESVIVDVSPDAKGMDPELFGGLADGLQEVIDIESGKIDESTYDVVYIQAEEHKDATGSHNYTN